jgi:hypothetical protein
MADDTDTQPEPVLPPDEPEQHVPDQTVPDAAPDEPAAPSDGRMGAGTVRAILIAVVVGAIAIGGTLFATGAFDTVSEEHAPRLAANGTTLARAKVGTCITWEGAAPTALAPVDCSAAHKFEVAGEPATTLPADAKYPADQQLAALREQVCTPVVADYLGQRLDPKSRYQLGLLTAGEKAWEAGDRTMRCGVQTVDGAGVVIETKGKIVNQDKATSWPPGTCIGINERGGATVPVDCAAPHAFEVTATVDLRQPFPEASWPTVAQQEQYLGATCPTRTTAWFGANDGLRKSGLQLQWNTITQPAWTAGARTAVCFVASSTDGRTYTPITGSAKSPNLLIDGKKPVMPTFPGAPAPKPGG